MGLWPTRNVLGVGLRVLLMQVDYAIAGPPRLWKADSTGKRSDKWGDLQIKTIRSQRHFDEVECPHNVQGL